MKYKSPVPDKNRPSWSALKTTSKSQTISEKRQQNWRPTKTGVAWNSSKNSIVPSQWGTCPLTNKNHCTSGNTIDYKINFKTPLMTEEEKWQKWNDEEDASEFKWQMQILWDVCNCLLPKRNHQKRFEPAGTRSEVKQIHVTLSALMADSEYFITETK